MNLYNIIITSIFNSFFLILIEGIIFFTLLFTVFNNVYQNVINKLLNQINTLINQNYATYIPIINVLSGIDLSKESLTFQSLAIKIYLVGTMYKEIIKEQKFLNLNKLKSYATYIAIILGFIIVIGIIIYINSKINNNYNNNTIIISSLLYNIIISLILFTIFILIISFIVFINIANNINTNTIQIQVIESIQQKIN